MSALSLQTRFNPVRYQPQLQDQQLAQLQPQSQRRLQLFGADSFTPARAGGTPSFDVARRLGPETNPRYQKRDITGDGKPETFCNWYTQDFMRARGLSQSQFPNMSANDTNRWLNSSAGRNAGWRKVSAEEAQRHVNDGGVGLVSRHNPRGHGHIAPIVEGQTQNGYPMISNVGSRNFLRGPANQSPAFRNSNTEYWVHD
ncbi:MAG: hypothetical protein JNK82_00815 [Myxococcaceae bacterium]|nr:hypothetical protein [Myxococcaceae bacterium]